MLWRKIPTKRVFDFPVGKLHGRFKGSEISILRVKAKATKINQE